MGDTACLMQPFCYASGISNEVNQSNPVHALGQSVSFGRFMSESLAWEKWSTFSHNRYVEEAERFSRPGSVAQKKAFFEAHYKRLAAQRAAALLEQSNNAASDNVEQQEHEAVTDDNHNSQTNSSMSESVRKTGKAELQSQTEDVDTHMEVSEDVTRTPLMHTPVLKSSNSDKENVASVSKKKPPVSSLKVTETSKFTSTPVKSSVSVSSQKDAFATPSSKSPALSSVEKKRTPRKSLHMSNFTPIRELNRLTASVMRKFESARGGAGSSKASKDSSLTPLKTPTMASKNEGQKHSSVTPLTEKKGTKTPIDSSASGSNKADPKWRLLSAEKKLRSPIISSPFSLRTEERAVRRKKKLEEKFNANEAQKAQLRTRLKEKAETEIRKLRQSFCFKARPLPDFYKERKAPKEEASKGIVSDLTHMDSPKEGRKAIESKSPLPAQRASVKNDGMNGRTPSRPLASNSVMNNMRIHRQIFNMGTKITDSKK